MADLGRWQSFIADNTGAIMPGAAITVRDEATGLLAVLYTDRAGTALAGNPIYSDSTGFAYFHALGGSYRIQVASGSYTADLRYVPVGSAAEGDLTEGTFTLATGATTTVVTDAACTATSKVFLAWETANAAAGLPTLYIVPGAGSFTVHHANNALTDRSYSYVIR